MNEKIKEFMRQAGTDVSGKWLGIDDAEKFAEAIIMECVNIAEQTRYDGKVVAARIKFVFGVE